MDDDNILNLESRTSVACDYGDNDDMCNDTVQKYQSDKDDTYNDIVPKYQIDSNNEIINLDEYNIISHVKHEVNNQESEAALLLLLLLLLHTVY